MKFILTAIALLTTVASITTAQTEKVKAYLKMVSLGNVEVVKIQLPDLLAEYPDDPGVLLLHAKVLNDPELSLKKHLEIIKNHSESQWADEAYLYVIQYYAAKGDTTKAQYELDNFRKKYGASELLGAATDAVRISELLNCDETRPTDVSAAQAIAANLNKPEEAPKPQDPKPIDVSPSSPVLKNPYSESKEETEKPDVVDEAPVAEDYPEDEDFEEEIDGDSYGLQVGIYSSWDAAKAEKERYRKYRMRSVIRRKEVDGNIMYAVVIGNYETKERAESSKQIVKELCNCNPIVFKK